MKLSDFLFNIGRPVAFYPGLVKAFGSLKQTVFICQMAYWKDKGDDPEGWIYKTSEVIENETSLTYKEQTNIREALVQKGALEERYARTEHQMYFRINWDVVNAIWEEHLTKGQVLHLTDGKVPLDQKADGTLPKGGSFNSNTESTTENTHKGGLSEIIESANKKVDAILENGRKFKYANRDKIPEAYVEFCDTYFELTGQEPHKSVIQDWLMTFSEWQSAGVKPLYIQTAWDRSERGNKFPVVRPGSLTNTIMAIKGMASSEQPRRKPEHIIHHASDYQELPHSKPPEDLRGKVHQSIAEIVAKQEVKK